MLTTYDILEPQGLIHRRLATYESRPEQLVMAQGIAEALAGPTHLVAEAGTGVGKSFAYLIPAILHAVAEQVKQFNDEDQTVSNSDTEEPDETSEKKGDKLRRVVISTHTISLQEQLFEKDIPFLNQILPLEFSSVLVKGRSNYLCLRRLEQAVKKASSLLADSQLEELMQLKQWSNDTADGSLSDLSYKPTIDVWGEIACEQGNCLRNRCKFQSKCFYQRARRRIEHAQLLVVNHALLFSDLALDQGGSILPNYDVLIIDEAHTIEQVAASHLGITVTKGQVDYILNRLYNDRTHKGLLTGTMNYPAIEDHVLKCRHCCENLFNDLYDRLAERMGINARVREPNVVFNHLSEPLNRLQILLEQPMTDCKDEGERLEFKMVRDRLKTLALTIQTWLEQKGDNFVYWIEKENNRNYPRARMEAAPIEVGPLLREKMFDKIASVIMTSATLATGDAVDNRYASKKSQHFAFFKKQIGLTDVPTLLVGSPFDFQRQAKVILVNGLVDSRVDQNRYRGQFAAMLKRYIAQTDGHAFVLFTAYTQMKQAASDLLPWLIEHEYPLFNQADGTPRHKMLEQFKKTPRSVLFGTDSFWQGIDVPGRALQNVIITKLPFLVPDQPLVEAKTERMKALGENPFAEYQLPHAILKFKQGFGRLIRSRTDTGIVVVLDSRIRTQRYGQQFLAALPNCPIQVDFVEDE